ncbi:MAG: hypothetical protein QOE45_2363 [Frankiaceae bacterium]|jgi:hypothetical protein|nr:hypothetical protein [Frankiaceae bacterium]
MPSAPRLRAAVPFGLLACAVLLAGCTSGDAKPRASATATVPLPTLPPGGLRDRVLQPDEVARSMVPIAAQTGARDITSIAGFSADPTTARTSLQQHGFQSAYVVQYADPATSAVVTNVVTKFATVAGATADLSGDLAAAARTGKPFAVTGLGDQAGGVTSRLQPGTADGSLVTLRWRVGDTTWLLAVGARNPVDADGVRHLADKLLARVGAGTS